MNEFGKRLGAVISKSKKSQKEVADLVGVSPAQISHFILGRRTPAVDMIAKLAQVLKVSAEELDPGYTSRVRSTQPTDLVHSMPGIVISIMNGAFDALIGGRQAFLEASPSMALESASGKMDSRGFDVVVEHVLVEHFQRFFDRCYVLSEEIGEAGQRQWADFLTFVIDPVDRSKHVERLLADTTAKTVAEGIERAEFDWHCLDHPTASVTAIFQGRIAFSLIVDLIGGEVYAACPAFVKHANVADVSTVEDLAERGEQIEFRQRAGGQIISYLGGSDKKTERLDFAKSLGLSAGQFASDAAYHEPGGPARVLMLADQAYEGFSCVLANGEKLQEWLPWLAFAMFSKKLAVFELLPMTNQVAIKDGVLATPTENYSVFAKSANELDAVNLRLAFLSELQFPARYRSAIAVACVDSVICAQLKRSLRSRQIVGERYR